MSKSLPWVAAAAVIMLGTTLWYTQPALREQRPTPAAPAERTSTPPSALEPPRRNIDLRKQPLIEVAPSRALAAPRRAALLSAPERAQLKAAIEQARATRSEFRPAKAPAGDQDTPASRAHALRIRQQIGEVAPLLGECYELDRAQQADTQGDLKVRLTIDGEPGVGGIVTACEITGGSLEARSELVNCVRETLYTVKFDPPEAGGTYVIQYPFVFSAAN